MRIFWHSLCLFLTAVTAVQADSYRHSSDRDDGFNPMNMMQGMPSPMGMFDSSERRRDARRHRPPPPVPGYYPYGYERAPAYGPPPVGQPPYGYPNRPAVAPRQSQTAPSAPPAPSHSSSQPAPQSPAAVQDGRDRSGDYSFRPMTPMQPEMDSAKPSAGPAEGAAPTGSWQGARQYTPTPPASTAPGGGTQPPATQASDEVMVNGRPAVFRPMNLGAEPPAQ